MLGGVSDVSGEFASLSFSSCPNVSVIYRIRGSSVRRRSTLCSEVVCCEVNVLCAVGYAMPVWLLRQIRTEFVQFSTQVSVDVSGQFKLAGVSRD